MMSLMTKMSRDEEENVNSEDENDKSGSEDDDWDDEE